MGRNKNEIPRVAEANLMVLVSNQGFSTGSFYWRHFGVVPAQVPTRTTGSDEDTPILFVGYEKAWNRYGAPVHGGDCPKCGGTGFGNLGLTSTELHLNPLNAYFYLICPLCGRSFRYLNQKEQVDDLEIVKSRKKTELDEDTDFPWYVVY